MLNLSHKKTINTFILAFILIAGLISLFKGILNAIDFSHDFQYSPAVMTWQNINHYNYILNGGKRGDLDDPIMLSQNGEYAQGLYVLMYLFSVLDWNTAKIVWLMCNIFLSVYIPFYLSKKKGLSKELIFLSIFLFLASTPTRNVIGNGQLSLFVLIALLLPFFYKSKIAIILSGFSYLKYNTGYLLFLYFLVLKSYKKLIYSSLFFILGWLVYSYITKTNPIECLFQPLKVTFYIKTTSELIYGFSFLKFIFTNSDQYVNFTVLTLSILFSLIFVNIIKNIEEVFLKISLFCLIILIFSPHRMYDYILLLPLMIYSLEKLKTSKIKVINLVLIFYIFYGLRLIKVFDVDIDNDIIINYINILIFFMLFIINYYQNFSSSCITVISKENILRKRI